MLKLPFPTFLAATVVTLEAEIRDEDGVEKVLLYSGPAIVDESAQRVKGAERQQVKMSGKIIIQGDILPGEDIQGFITFNGKERVITTTSRPRNPDGSVFSTEIGFE